MIYGYEIVKYIVIFDNANKNCRRQKTFYKVEEAIEYAQRLERRNPVIHEIRKILI